MSNVAASGASPARLSSTACHSIRVRFRALPTAPITCAFTVLLLFPDFFMVSLIRFITSTTGPIGLHHYINPDSLVKMVRSPPNVHFHTLSLCFKRCTQMTRQSAHRIKEDQGSGMWGGERHGKHRHAWEASMTTARRSAGWDREWPASTMADTSVDTSRRLPVTPSPASSRASFRSACPATAQFD